MFFRDDDTFFPDYTSLVRLLASYDSAQDVIIGALSETYKQVEVSTDPLRSILEGNLFNSCLTDLRTHGLWRCRNLCQSDADGKDEWSRTL